MAAGVLDPQEQRLALGSASCRRTVRRPTVSLQVTDKSLGLQVRQKELCSYNSQLECDC